MDDNCLLQIYTCLLPEARVVLQILLKIEAGTMEHIMKCGPLTTQQTRKAVWGLSCTGLISYRRGGPVALSENGQRLGDLLKQQQAEGRQ